MDSYKGLAPRPAQQDAPGYNRGIPFFVYFHFLNNGALALTKNRRKFAIFFFA